MFSHDVSAWTFRGVLLRGPCADVTVTCKGTRYRVRYVHVFNERYKHGPQEREHVIAVIIIIFGGGRLVLKLVGGERLA